MKNLSSAFQIGRKHQVLIVIAFILVGINLRPPMATIGPLLPFIQKDLDLTFTQISLLTALPVFTMGIAMFISNRLLKYLDPFKLIAYALVLIGFSNLCRLLINSGQYGLIFTAITAGSGIAIVQAILPFVIKKNFSNHIAFYMGIYVTAIMGGAALSAGLAPFIERYFKNWQFTVSFWAVLAPFALATWFRIKPFISVKISETESLKKITFMHLPRAWLLCIFFGLGTASYTCVLAWLPPYFIELGWSNTQAGFLLAALTIMEVIAGILFPSLSNQNQDRRIILSIVVLCCIMGYLGLIFLPTIFTYLWICLLGLGIGGLFPMSLIVSMDHATNVQQAGQLTIFVQGMGYMIAAFSPFMAGLLRDQTGSFSLAWSLLLFISCILLIMIPRFNPQHYAKKMFVKN